MKYIIFIFSILLSFPVLSQEHDQKPRKRVYISIDQFQELIGPLTVQDSLDMMIRGKDTLILIRPHHNYQPPTGGVRVPYEPKDSLFLELYKDVVYNPDGNSRDETMKIWKDDVKIFFAPSVPKDHQKILMDFSKKLSSDIDSLNIRKVEELKKANYLVYYLGGEYKFDYAPGISNDRSSYFIYWNGKQQFYQAFLKVNTEEILNEEEQIAQLKYNFFRSLGNFIPSNKLSCRSYLSSCSAERELTEIDLEILKYHYSYGVCKGVDLQSFENLHSEYQALLKKHPDGKTKLFVVHLK